MGVIREPIYELAKWLIWPAIHDRPPDTNRRNIADYAMAVPHCTARVADTRCVVKRPRGEVVVGQTGCGGGSGMQAARLDGAVSWVPAFVCGVSSTRAGMTFAARLRLGDPHPYPLPASPRALDILVLPKDGPTARGGEEQAAAPHPLPALLARAEREALRGERDARGAGRVPQRCFGNQPCFAACLGGTPSGNATHAWRCSSQTAIVGAGKPGSAKVPMATAT